MDMTARRTTFRLSRFVPIAFFDGLGWTPNYLEQSNSKNNYRNNEGFL
jgi:hypothetical protein